MNTQESMSRAFVDAVIARPKLQHAAVRVGLWLTGAAEQQGGWPVEAHIANFLHGIKRTNLTIPGIRFRPETVKKSISALEEAGLLSVEEGTTELGGHVSKLFTLHLS